MVLPSLISCLCSSIPDIPGIWTSVIKHAISGRRGDARNSAADEKASTAKPNDLMSLRMDSRTDRSSSTTETNAVLGTWPPGSRLSAIWVLHQCRRARTVSCAEECPQAMLGTVNVGLVLMRCPLSGCQHATDPRSALVNLGLGCGRIVEENANVHIHRPGLAMSPSLRKACEPRQRAHST
jgi:hypothetical protein